ncbi:MAG: NADH-quinone oxidoreductase subunit L [Chloroflexaceae bacterium]|nr:NADH-quinone oxidoreductase subunit L [Chloroflexaceae bacterium]
MANVLWLIPLLPLLGFLLNVLVVWRDSDAARRERNAGYIACGAVGLAFVLAFIAFIELAMLPHEEQHMHVVLWEWINTGSFSVPIGLLFDPLSSVMVLLVTGVGTLIHVYSIGYMHNDERVVRYFAYLNLFIVMMLMLVMADNLLLLFLGWEGVGLCSFLLIGHWFERKTASDAAVKAFVVNRIGDAGMLLAMMTIFAHFGTLSFVGEESFLERAREIAGQYVTIPGQPTWILLTTGISLLLLVGVTGKSAQLPLFVWLPDAMAGPTPVSALIHAATMVTAGVYLMARTHSIFTLSPTAQSVVTFVGVATALIGGTAAIAQWDIKRVLAYSTVSQLGYMVAAAGMGAYAVAIFHLLTHGIFKALLFLASGSVIHGAHDVQDMRRMGGLRKAMPTTFRVYAIGAIALAGIFPLAGFWSKDEILATAWGKGQIGIFAILFITSMLTAFYMGRQIALVFFGEQRDSSYHAHESGPMMTWPLWILAVGAVIGGAMNLPVLHTLTHWLEPVLEEEGKAFDLTTLILALVATGAAVGSAYGGLRYYMHNAHRIKPNRQDPLYRYFGDIWNMFEEAWYVDQTYERYTVVPWYRSLAGFLGEIFDPQGIDGMVHGVARLVQGAAAGVRLVQNGYVRTYALVFLTGVIAIIGYLVIAW